MIIPPTSQSSSKDKNESSPSDSDFDDDEDPDQIEVPGQCFVYRMCEILQYFFVDIR